jgi:PIN domain nuclease of toxin-antitoxin system
MASRTFLDTHVVIWTFAGRTSRLSLAARRAIEKDSLHVSPMVVLEIDMLREIGRINESGETMVSDLAARLDLRISDTDFRSVATAAGAQSWTLDPFDRIIVGHASVHDAPLVTKDQGMLDNYPNALW